MRTIGQIVPDSLTIWLGVTEGQWPVQSFTTEAHALSWAAEGDPNNNRRWVSEPITLDPTLKLRRAVKLPPRNEWVTEDE